MDTNPTTTYALIGYPVGHSFSAEYFNDKFRREGLVEHYSAESLPDIKMLPELFAKYPNLKGMNVTSPWKEAVIEYLDEVTPEALSIHAVNTVKVTYPEGRRHLSGHNTDIYGFRESLRPLLHRSGISALVFGTGGASHAVEEVLRQLDILYKIVSRDASKGLTYDDVAPEVVSDNLLLINATPLGMGKHIGACVPIPYDAVGPQHICCDLIYNPAETEFLRRCKARGATVSNGLKMLHLQAQEAWKIWSGENF